MHKWDSCWVQTYRVFVLSKIVYFQGGMAETEGKDHRVLEDLRDQKVSVQP